jgi:N-acetylmuramoyl-L-alanine amidase
MKNLIKLSIITVVFLSFAFIPKNEKITVVIDAGHGGLDLGATMNGLSEKEIVSSIAQKIKTLNSNSNIEILLTRTEDQTMSFQERVDFVNGVKPDLVISLHANTSKNKESNGLEVFVSDKSTEYIASNELAQRFSNTISNKTQLKVRPVNIGPFFILRKSEVPAILIELGFLSNEKDKSYLENKDNQIKIAQNILDFVANLKS